MIKFSKDHAWVVVEGDTATIGISHFAQQNLNDIIYVEIETEGQSLKQGEVYGTLEAVKTVSDLYLPLSGEILEYNRILDDEPELINQSPYDQGWIIKLKPSNPFELSTLMSKEEYEQQFS